MNLDLGDKRSPQPTADGNCTVSNLLPDDLTSLNLKKQSQVHPGVAEKKTVLKKKKKVIMVIIIQAFKLSHRSPYLIIS